MTLAAAPVLPAPAPAVAPDRATAGAAARVVHVGLLGERPGGMAQVVNEYLTWRETGLVQRGLLTTRRAHDPAAPLLAAGAALRLLGLARGARHTPTVVVVHVSEGGSFAREGALLVAARRLGLATMAHVHGAAFDDFAAARPALVRRVLGAADAVAVLTDRSAATVRGLLPGARVEVVRNAVAPGLRAPKHREVLFGGELGPRKGADVLLAAWPAVAASRPGWRLVLAGPLAPGYTLPALPPSAEWTGPLPHARLRERLAAAAVAVLPSRQEALPVFLLEALAAGCATVGSATGQVPRLLADGAGLVVPPGDAGALADALFAVTGDAALRTGLAARGTERWAGDYSTAAARAGLEALWREVARARHA